MTNIDAKGMKVATLTDDQFEKLRQAEKAMNDASGNKEELYLLAVTR